MSDDSTATYSSTSPGMQGDSNRKRFIDLFKCYPNAHGYVLENGLKWDEEKSKWKGGFTKREGVTAEDFDSFFNGVRHLGVNPNTGNGTVWFACIDVDIYEIDYAEEMAKIERTDLPVVVCRTKSGGLRIFVFFKESVSAELACRLLTRWSALLGYAGSEIFPKQVGSMDNREDCGNWIYLPYGPTFGKLAMQCAMNGSGNPMTLDEFVRKAEAAKITESDVQNLLAGEEKIKSTARLNGKRKNNGGKWIEEDNREGTIIAMFCDGPPCMWDIAREGCRVNQHDFLIGVSTFFKRKYTENWDMALTWVNDHVLIPAGNSGKLLEIVRTTKGKDYEYRCKTEPICSHCNPYACRKMKYGVGGAGSGSGGGNDHRELGMVIVDRVPRIYYINVGDKRIAMNTKELFNMNLYREKCADYGVDFPDKLKQWEWDNIIRTGIENAAMIDAPELLRTYAYEIGVVQRYLGIHIPNLVRRLGKAGLTGEGEGPNDPVRVRIDVKRFYLKFLRFENFCLRMYNMNKRDMHDIKMFMVECGTYHDRVDGRGWFRSTYSIGFDLFDQETIEEWLKGVEMADGEQSE